MDRFWTPWQERTAQTGIPHQWRQCEETGRLENLRRCARGDSDGHQGLRFNDSDVTKLLEASAYAIALGMGEGSERSVGEAVDLLAAAQQKDGYINSFVQLGHPEMRWKSLNALHEMYCIGHLIEAGVAHHEATGQTRLLDVSKKAAECVMSEFGPGKRLGYADHQEMELALVRLFDATGERRYFEYAKWQIQARGSRPSPFEAELSDPAVVALTPGVKPLYMKDGAYDGAYAQDDMPLARQTRAVGHAVRAMYFYCGAVDALAEDAPTMGALKTIWASLVSRQMYLTGGIGSSGRNEGFTTDYDLPNMDAYAETCAGIGLVFWAWRMFLATCEAQYVDVMERALYNAVLSGVSFGCDRFFYDNPLESDGRHERAAWFSCACCPPNIARLLMSLGQYCVAFSASDAYVALPVSGSFSGPSARFQISGSYPWSGDYEVTLGGASGLRRICLRVPGWSRGLDVRVNGGSVDGPVADGFIALERDWKEGDRVSVTCPMGASLLAAHPSVSSCAGRVAVQRGPLVYCAEQHDLGAAPQFFTVDTRVPAREAGGSTNGVEACLEVSGTMDRVQGSELYGDAARTTTIGSRAKLVPYFSWANRGPNSMLVWLRRA